MNIPEEVLDQAAQDAYAAYYGHRPDEWEKAWRNEDRVDWANVARAALSAAAPHLMATAWDEGWNAGAGWPQGDKNPYRSES